MKYLIFTLLLLIYSSPFACSFDGNETNGGFLTPTAAYQTQTSVTSGQYFSLNVNCGYTYNFNFCNNGGTASWDTQITLLQTDGTTEIMFNDDACSLQSDITWTSNFTGTIYVLVSQYTCNNNGSQSGATMAYNMTPSANNPSFTLAVACGGGNSTVTGDPGGTFSFNPIPGDGAQINTNTGIVSNGTIGTTYSVEYSLCGNSSIETVTVLDDNCWSLNGNAQNVNISGDDCIELTSAANNQIGCSWNSQQLDFNSDFTLTLDYFFGANVNGADGSTFTFHPGVSTACGANGGQLGAGNIANSLVIEFDTYDNDNPSHIYDLSCDHIAVEIDGDLQNGTPAAGPVCAKASGGSIDDGTTYTVEIQWNAATQTLDVYFDNALRLSYTNDIVNNVFGGQNMVYWGATAATGGLNNQQYFCPNTVVILPTEIGTFTAKCNEKEEVVQWTTISESRVDYFEIEYTYDNLSFFPIEQVNAVGTSQIEHFYKVSFSIEDKNKRYYRLKSVDENGDFNYTGIIASEQCMSNDVIQSIYNNPNKLTIVTNGAANVQIMNQLGQTIIDQATKNQFITISTQSLATGFYFILAEDSNGNRATRKIYLN